MNAQTCLKKLQYVGVLNFATVGPDGTPQIRCISAIHYETDALYFLQPEEKRSVKSCFVTGGYKYLHIPVTKK